MIKFLLFYLFITNIIGLCLQVYIWDAYSFG